VLRFRTKESMMKKASFRGAGWVVVCACAVAFGQADRSGRPRNVILIGWDGAQRQHVNECLSRDELPAIKALAAEGRMVNIDIHNVTDTKAGWTQILTGYDPNVTGVYSDAKYQAIPKGLSVFERLKEHFGPDRFVAVAVIGKRKNCGENDPPIKTPVAEAVKAQPASGKRQAFELGSYTVEENGVKYRITPGKPYLHTSKACDEWIFGLLQNEKVADKTVELLDKYKDRPFFFFVHFGEGDEKGHKYGENSREYNDALISDDACTGRIVQKVKDLKLYDTTLIYVTADHGFDEGRTNHLAAPRVFLVTNDPKVCRAGDRADITPTIMDRFGLDLNTLSRKEITATRPNEKDPPLAGHSLLRPLEKAKQE
jgi:hypothetical protein